MWGGVDVGDGECGRGDVVGDAAARGGERGVRSAGRGVGGVVVVRCCVIGDLFYDWDDDVVVCVFCVVVDGEWGEFDGVCVDGVFGV